MRRNFALALSSILLASCGGDDDSNGSAQTYTVSATVSGLQAGATVRTLYLRDRGSKDFSGVFSRGAFSTTEDSGTDTPAANPWCSDSSENS